MRERFLRLTLEPAPPEMRRKFDQAAAPEGGAA
jgi:hypothetical protein